LKISSFLTVFLLWTGFSAAGPSPEAAEWVNPLRVHFIDVGQGDCSLIQCPDGSTILVDGGRIWTYPFLIDYLRDAGVEKIDLMVVSHPHGDHYGGLIKVLKTFPVATILDSGKEDTTEHYQRYLETVKSLPEVGFKLARAGDRYSFGKVGILIIHPSSRLLSTPNNCSIIFRLTYGGSSFLFTGDAERKAEQEAMRRGFNLRSAVLKVGHHGSRTSTGPAFLSRVSPRWAVIPAGEDNSYGHPHPEVTRRLKMRGTRIYQTGVQGTVLFLTDGRDYRVELPGRAFYPEYEIPPDQSSRIIANRETLIYYLPRSPHTVQIPPEDRVFFDTTVAAENAGYRRYWW
jgi:competence protein ComEC